MHSSKNQLRNKKFNNLDLRGVGKVNKNKMEDPQLKISYENSSPIFVLEPECVTKS